MVKAVDPAGLNAQMGQAPVSKNLQGATYGNPFQAPYTENTYSQNVAPPEVTGGGEAYTNPYSVVDQHFFNPTTPNDPAFSDMQAPNEISVADPIGQIKSDFAEAQTKLPNNGGK
jgi:hypothetical protein